MPVATRRSERYDQQANIPSPDPSLRTTEELRHGLNSLRELVETRFTAMDKASVLFNENLSRTPTEIDKQVTHLRSLLESRISTVDHLIKLITDDVKQFPAEIGRFVENLRQLHDEKFTSIQTQFLERDVRATASEDAAKIAVNAALQAQKEAAAAQNQANSEAITKSEAATAKQIDAIQALITTNNKANDEKIGSVLTLIAANNKAIDEKIALLNARQNIGEGGTSARSTQNTMMIAVIAVLVSIVVGGFAIMHSGNTIPTAMPAYNMTNPH
jgi:hypothetical protein